MRRATHPLAGLVKHRGLTAEDAAILIAQDLNPLFDSAAVRQQLDEWGAELIVRLPKERTAIHDARALSRFMFDELGFRGAEDDYYDPKNSCIDEVIARRKGIPITLSIVAMAIGRRAEIIVEGVGFPGHFLVRVGGPNGAYQDPFNGGRILNGGALRALAARFLGGEGALHPSYLEPVDTPTIAIRMLANLKSAYRRRGDFARAMVACDRLVDLTGAPEHRRDRGLLAHMLQTYAAATEDLSAYLAARPNAKDAGAVQRTLLDAKEHIGQLLH